MTERDRVLTGMFRDRDSAERAYESLTSRGYGDGGDSGIGFLGALVGGLLLSLLGIQGQGGLVASTAAAFVGAILLTGLAWAAQRRATEGNSVAMERDS